MLFIGTPLYENKISCQYLHGLMQTANTLNTHGMSMEYAFEQGTYIAINREKLVRRFLKSNKQVFLFIDADTSFTVLNVLSLMSTNVDVVSGIYSYRIPVKDTVKHCFRDLNSQPINMTGKELQECSFVPTGMLMIRREVLERLYTKHEFIFDQGFRDTEYFRKLWGDEGDELLKRFEGEDIHFCRLWREMGGQLWAKTSVKVGHIGEQVYEI
jgi:hypothetical protein